VKKWLEAGTVGRFACTIKFQGATDFEAMREFAAIPGSRLLHLHHNKHELTWVKL
jgi:23S rRNA (cytidine2498-2'-O)-methyltransferase